MLRILVVYTAGWSRENVGPTFWDCGESICYLSPGKAYKLSGFQHLARSTGMYEAMNDGIFENKHYMVSMIHAYAFWRVVAKIFRIVYCHLKVNNIVPF